MHWPSIKNTWGNGEWLYFDWNPCRFLSHRADWRVEREILTACCACFGSALPAMWKCFRVIRTR